jgi:hypothetical protein
MYMYYYSTLLHTLRVWANKNDPVPRTMCHQSRIWHLKNFQPDISPAFKCLPGYASKPTMNVNFFTENVIDKFRHIMEWATLWAIFFFTKPFLFTLTAGKQIRMGSQLDRWPGPVLISGQFLMKSLPAAVWEHEKLGRFKERRKHFFH